MDIDLNLEVGFHNYYIRAAVEVGHPKQYSDAREHRKHVGDGRADKILPSKIPVNPQVLLRVKANFHFATKSHSTKLLLDVGGHILPVGPKNSLPQHQDLERIAVDQMAVQLSSLFLGCQLALTRYERAEVQGDVEQDVGICNRPPAAREQEAPGTARHARERRGQGASQQLAAPAGPCRRPSANEAQRGTVRLRVEGLQE
mmetsp:Transcript_26269/g.61512  ORF Transcript_26269/g.61512 Transcript_26269/m.61512 type:complete len:201 (-) Transcript_26269:949-1551(-)